MIDYIENSVEILMKLKMDDIVETYHNTALLKNYKNSSGICPKCKAADKPKKEKQVVVPNVAYTKDDLK